MDIYWIQGHEQKGPLPEVEVISMLEAGLIPENARAWHAGCPEWVCIRDLPALKGAGAVSRGEGERRNREEEGLENAGEEQAPALAADADCPQEEGGTASEEGAPLVVPYAYVRFLGRMADIMMHMTLYLSVLKFPAWLSIPVSFLVPMKLCFTSASRWFSLKLPFLVHWEQPREKPCWAFPSGTTGEGVFLSPRHSGAPCSSWCLAWGVLLLP